MAVKTGDLVTIQGNLALVEVYSNTDSEWVEVYGASAVDKPTGTRDSTTVNAFRGNATVQGVRPIENVTFTIASYLPYMPVWDQIRAADKAQQSLNWRLTTIGDTKFSTAVGEVAVAASTGKISFTGTEAPDESTLVAGMCLFTGTSGNDHYVITEIDLTGTTYTITGSPKTVYGKAPGYAEGTPSVQVTTLAKVANTGSFTLGVDSGSPLASTLIVTPDVEINEGMVVRPVAAA